MRKTADIENTSSQSRQIVCERKGRLLEQEVGEDYEKDTGGDDKKQEKNHII